MDWVSDAWVSVSELKLEWVTMDDTFINRVGVGGGWSRTNAYIQKYNSGNTTQKKNQMALTLSDWAIILDFQNIIVYKNIFKM